MSPRGGGPAPGEEPAREDAPADERAAAASRPRVVVLGWGNTARGDDGLGPLLLERIAGLGLANVETIEDFQLQLEHALDLDGADLALFVDASVAAAAAPFAFGEIEPRQGLTHSSHALAPEAVLDVHVRVLGRAPPPAFVLAVRGERFELGEPLGAAAAAHLEAAFAFVRPLLETPRPAFWRAAATAWADGRV